jgi:sugar phosphate isomerase/epimerase
MAEHPVTLFTGQWADLPFEEVARLAASWGYDGLEIAASGDHLDLQRADEDESYLRSRLEILDRHGLGVYAISNHLAGQAVCDAPIDFRHEAILRPYVWGDGDAEGVRARAAEDMKRAARVARRLGVDTVVGFTGSSIWSYVAMFPPVPASVIDDGFEDFARRWNPILDVFDDEGVRFAHEVHPGEIAYDYWTSVRALDAFRALDAIGYTGPISIEWEDAGMDRLHGAAEAVEFVRSLLWRAPDAAFDAAFRTGAAVSAE